jgi:hypothetical protein
LNRIGQFFGLEVAFVPVRRTPAVEPAPAVADTRQAADAILRRANKLAQEAHDLEERLRASTLALNEALQLLRSQNK